ncbi:MAG: hypothetical protein KC489_05335, partial [Gemmatimonadetes bacterium]|nr:hypothetical protein [Gemmatimonadota bacterium]
GLDVATTERLIRNAQVNATLTALFLLVTWAVVLASARSWTRSETRDARSEDALVAVGRQATA